MYHIYPKDKDEKVINFVKYFMEKDADLLKAILVTGAISPNLSRSHRVLQENRINIIHIHTLPIIQPIIGNHEALFHPTFLDKNKLITTPSILGECYAKVAIDARTGNICLNFDIEKFKRESENCMDKAIKARNTGMEFRFSHEDWVEYK